MNAFDDAFLQGFSAALAIARATAGRIAAGDMHVLRREMAAEALRSFAEEARDALAPIWVCSILSRPPRAHLRRASAGISAPAPPRSAMLAKPAPIARISRSCGTGRA